MDLDNLQTFIKVAETRSFSLSAKAMKLSQPAISKRIAALETRLETRLFDRLGRTVHLTEAGRVLLPGAKQIQLEVSRIEDVLRGSSGTICGVLKLATTTCVLTTQLPSLLSEYRQEYEDVEIDFTIAETEGVLDNIRDNTHELAICPLFGNSIDNLPSSLLGAALMTTPLKIVVHKENPLAFESSISVTQLSNSKAILPKPGSLARKAIEKELTVSADYSEVSVSSDEFGTMRSLASMGMGWTLQPPHMIDDTLAVLNVPELSFTQTLALVRHRDRSLSKAAAALLRTMPVSPVKS